MILAITILSGIMFLFYFGYTLYDSIASHETNVLTYGTILVLSTWYLNIVVGIVFLCLVVLMSIVAVLKVISDQ